MNPKSMVQQNSQLEGLGTLSSLYRYSLHNTVLPPVSVLDIAALPPCYPFLALSGTTLNHLSCQFVSLCM